MLAEAQLMRETGGKSKVEWTLCPLDFRLTLTLTLTLTPNHAKCSGL